MKVRTCCLAFVIALSGILLPRVASGQNPEATGELQSWTPFQLALVEPLQLFPKETSVAGLRLNLLYGVNKDVWGIDLGLWNISGRSRGIQFGFANKSSSLYGIQVGAANVAFENSLAVQFGVINGSGASHKGIQLGIVNDAGSLVEGSTFSGIQVGGLNVPLFRFAPWAPESISPTEGTKLKGIEFGLANAKRAVTGISVGGINYAENVVGLQAGLVNYATTVQGLQVGLLNINRTGYVPYLPLLNGGW